MKTNKKALELVESGLKSDTVSKMSESQIDVLHNKLFNEQTGVRREKETVDKTTISQQALETGVNVDGKTMKRDNAGNVVVTSTNEEMTEGDKDEKNNPWAICHKQLGPKRNAKFESCVKQVKKSLKEGKNPLTLFLEDKIMKLVETHLPPKITKKDLIKYLNEAEPAVAPVKDPKVKPGTKEPQQPKKNPSTPGRDPRPKIKPAPQAISPEDAKEKIIDTIMQMLEK